MKITTGFLLLFFNVQLLVAQSTISDSEDMRFNAQVKKDTVLLRRILSDDLVYIHSNALVETKSDFLHSISTGNITYNSMQPEPGRAIRNYGKTGISNGIVQVKGLIQGKPFEVRLRYTAVYVKQKKTWRLVSWQSTKIP
ncbi:MAG: nuclear transport factor 2 family protein [Saprospiraceae bacterium]|nr:nuclear transport factor 2 family protein [Saprospiraceae bacterium]